jgi:hypothetical protein
MHKTEGPWNFPQGHFFSVYLILSGAVRPGSFTRLLTEMSTRRSSWVVKHGRSVRLTSLPPSMSRFSRQSYRPPPPSRGLALLSSCTLLFSQFRPVPWNFDTWHMAIVLSVVIYWFEHLHLHTIFPSRVYLKSDLGKTFQLDLNAPLSCALFFSTITCEKSLRLLPLNSRCPHRAIGKACGTHNMQRSDWDCDTYRKIYILFPWRADGDNWNLGLSILREISVKSCELYSVV